MVQVVTAEEKLSGLLEKLEKAEAFFKSISEIKMDEFPEEKGVHIGYGECAKWIGKIRREFDGR